MEIFYGKNDIYLNITDIIKKKNIKIIPKYNIQKDKLFGDPLFKVVKNIKIKFSDTEIIEIEDGIEIDLDNINKEKLLNIFNVYIITTNLAGGSGKYIKDIQNKYGNNCNFNILNSIKSFASIKFKKDDIILLGHFFGLNINIIDIINLKINCKCKLIIPIHDFYWLTHNLNINSDGCHNIYLKNNIEINDNTKQLFSVADDIIHPSQFTYDIYSKYFPNTNFKIVHHNDYFIDNSSKYISPIINNVINIGVLTVYSQYKGKNYVELLKNKYTTYNNYKIIFMINKINIPEYNENAFYDYVKKYNLHCLVFLNKWGETWCYTLTKGINSGLPIIYNNIGAFKERIQEKEHYFKVNEHETDNEDNQSKLYKTFENMLDYIIINNGKFNNMNTNNEIIYNHYYDTLFNTKKYIFAIYFPQFHKIKENDINYYENFSDIKNLSLYLNENNSEKSEKLEKPLMSLFNLNNLLEYDITDNNITSKQVETAINYGISGFAIYYYWFSINTITNNHSIMELGYSNFFKNNFENFKIYFIWANENWTDNPAFNVLNNTISNIYNIENFIENSNNLIKYFKHENYYKIDNKPVFMIHHPWFISNENIDLFFSVLNSKCIENNFKGVELIINSMSNTYEKYQNYSFHPNYKNPHIKSTNRILDYKEYTDTLILNKNTINTLFFDFNNTARLYKPNLLHKATKTVNNEEQNFIKYIEKINKSYINSSSNILLINAWNEWGEKMSIEPSEEKKFYYLNLIKKYLVSK